MLTPVSSGLLSVHRDAAIGPGGGYLVGTNTTKQSGANTFMSVSVPSGAAAGDLALIAGATRNSIPDVLGPEDGGWTELLRVDTATNEYNFVYWKILGGSEPASWQLDLSAAATSVMGVQVFRGPKSALGINTAELSVDFPTPGYGAHERGIVAFGWCHSFDNFYITVNDDSTASLDYSVHFTDAGSDNPQVCAGHYVTRARDRSDIDRMKSGALHLSDNPLDITYGTSWSVMLAA